MFDERFARQYRYEPPSEFPLNLPFTGIVHHLSGLNKYARTQTSHNWAVGYWCKNIPNIIFITQRSITPQTCTCVKLLGPCFKTGRMYFFGHHFHVVKSSRTQGARTIKQSTILRAIHKLNLNLNVLLHKSKDSCLDCFYGCESMKAQNTSNIAHSQI